MEKALKETHNLFETVIVGGGPAGTGLLLKAIQDGRIDDLLSGGVALIEQGDQLISGMLTNFQVNSDTRSDVFLECLEGQAAAYVDLAALQDEIAFIKEYEGKSIPLNLLNPYFRKLGDQLKKLIEGHPKSRIFLQNRVESISQDKRDIYQIQLSSGNFIYAKKLVIACGGKPYSAQNPYFFPNIDLKVYQQKSLHSDQLIKGKTPAFLQKKWQNPSQVVILGGSHSALSAAQFLLTHHEKAFASPASIKIWSPKKPKIYFNSREEALAHGYTDFDEQDFCPLTQRLYRLAGLRMEGRHLYMSMLGMTDSLEERVKCFYPEAGQALFQDHIEEADCLIYATGYSFDMPPFFDQERKPVSFVGPQSRHWLNASCQLLLENGEVLPQVFGIGLASGFIPGGKLGGEPSFSGQTNGIWYYQHAIASLILDKLLI